MTKNEYTITPLRDNPGIFYETIGELRTTEIYWKMITYIDITDIFGILEKIQKKIELAIQQCDNISEICIAQKQLILLRNYIKFFNIKTTFASLSETIE